MNQLKSMMKSINSVAIASLSLKVKRKYKLDDSKLMVRKKKNLIHQLFLKKSQNCDMLVVIKVIKKNNKQ